MPDGASAEERAGAEAAAQAWNGMAGAQLVVPAAAPSGGAQLPVRFERAAAPSHGFFDAVAGQVLINDDLAGQPHALTVTIAHEVGHAFGLVHVTNRSSVMNPGNLDVEPNAGDVEALVALWGQCGQRVGAE